MADVLLSASLQVLFDRLASPELVNFIRRKNLSHDLLNELKRKSVVVHKVLNDAEMKQILTSLTHFAIFGGCEDVELFPKECLLPSSLTFLAVYGLPNLKSLDSKGLQQLTSLEILHIYGCREFQYLTRKRLSDSVSCLIVDPCPLLKQQCQFEKGPECPSLFGVLMTKGGLFGNNQVDQLQKMIIEIIDMDP
uniref:Disease resistance protein n=1 Tax=Vitis vinifera TaxID=29760 RepID=F6HPU5_VITVI